MGGKKDPGKFTVRFNVADPQQRTAADLLNQQGRCKAQFITNAVLFYVNAANSSPPVGAVFHPITMDDENVADKHGTRQKEDLSCSLEDSDMDSILRTMDAFHGK